MLISPKFYLSDAFIGILRQIFVFRFSNSGLGTLLLCTQAHHTQLATVYHIQRTTQRFFEQAFPLFLTYANKSNRYCH